MTIKPENAKKLTQLVRDFLINHRDVHYWIGEHTHVENTSMHDDLIKQDNIESIIYYSDFMPNSFEYSRVPVEFSKQLLPYHQFNYAKDLKDAMINFNVTDINVIDSMLENNQHLFKNQWFIEKQISNFLEQNIPTPDFEKIIKKFFPTLLKEYLYEEIPCFVYKLNMSFFAKDIHTTMDKTQVFLKNILEQIQGNEKNLGILGVKEFQYINNQSHFSLIFEDVKEKKLIEKFLNELQNLEKYQKYHDDLSEDSQDYSKVTSYILMETSLKNKEKNKLKTKI